MDHRILLRTYHYGVSVCQCCGYTSGEVIEKNVKEILDLTPKAEQMLAAIIGIGKEKK